MVKSETYIRTDSSDLETRLIAALLRIKELEANQEEMQSKIDNLMKTKYPIIADDNTVYAIQKELYAIKCQIGEIRQFILLQNRIFTNHNDKK